MERPIESGEGIELPAVGQPTETQSGHQMGARKDIVSCWTNAPRSPGWLASPEFIEQRLGVLQIRRIEPLGEPTRTRAPAGHRRPGACLETATRRAAGGGAQLQKFEVTVLRCASACVFRSKATNKIPEQFLIRVYRNRASWILFVLHQLAGTVRVDADFWCPGLFVDNRNRSSGVRPIGANAHGGSAAVRSAPSARTTESCWLTTRTRPSYGGSSALLCRSI
jgi:hypothetical protein